MKKRELQQIYLRFYNPMKSPHETDLHGNILIGNSDLNFHGSRKARLFSVEKWQSMTPNQRKLA